MTDRLRLAVEGHRIELDLDGDGRAESWQVDDLELLGAKSADPVEYGMYAMGPWAGRLSDNGFDYDGTRVQMPVTHAQWALHGTTLTRRCVVVDHVASSETATATAIVDVDLGPTWPWPGVLRAHWMLTHDALRTRLELIASEGEFPGVVGWHPWFIRTIQGRNAIWTLEGAQIAERDDDYRLSGRLRDVTAEPGTFDDAFHVANGRACIAWPDLLRIDISSSHRWFVVFDREPGLLCVEPQSGPPNGLNDGLGDPILTATPGRPIVLETEWRISRGAQQR